MDSYTKVLLHGDGSDDGTTFTDTVGTHTWTRSGNTVTKTSVKKFGTASIYFDGGGDNLHASDHADFDFSGGVWTIDFWTQGTSLQDSTAYYFFYQKVDAANTIWAYYNQPKSAETNGMLAFDIYTNSTCKANLTTTINKTTFQSIFSHIQIAENGDNFYLFVDGSLQDYKTSTGRPLNYTSDFYIGSLGTVGNYYKGYIDEFRISNGVCRNTTDFTPNTIPYGIISTKVSSAWKEVSGIYTKVSGSWKEVNNVYTKVSGSWKQL